MKLCHFLLILFISISTLGFAHDANIAFFKIQQKENTVEVQAEFPWSIRNAVVEAYPRLESSNNQEDFDVAFFEYVKSNFQLRQNNSVLTLISIEYDAQQGHSHQSNFVFVFEGNQFDSIKNTMMFNAYVNQENYHDILLDTEHVKFITSKDSSSFQMESQSQNSLGNTTTTIGLLIAVVIVLGLFLFIRLKK
tara:strand:- start:1233 stop:1811 length:579 start_codon:yes stop_codon:yes gene_type:complete